MKPYRFSARLWRWPGNAAWHFITVPKKESLHIKESVPQKRGFGSVPVQVSVGESVWNTSVFPDSRSGTYLLPMKRAIRSAEGIDEGDTVSVSLVVRREK